VPHPAPPRYAHHCPAALPGQPANSPETLPATAVAGPARSESGPPVLPVRQFSGQVGQSDCAPVMA